MFGSSIFGPCRPPSVGFSKKHVVYPTLLFLSPSNMNKINDWSPSAELAELLTSNLEQLKKKQIVFVAV